MSALQNLIDKLRQLLGKHSDKAEKGVDRVTQLADDKTGGKYSDKIQQGAQKAKGVISEQGNGETGASGSSGETGASGSSGESTGSSEQQAGDSQVPKPREDRP